MLGAHAGAGLADNDGDSNGDDGMDNVGTRGARRALPVDVRVSDGTRATEELLVEAVLDALPSPTVLLDPDGTVVLTNSVWRDAPPVLDDERLHVGVGGDYFALAPLGPHAAPAPRMIRAR